MWAIEFLEAGGGALLAGILAAVTLARSLNWWYLLLMAGLVALTLIFGALVLTAPTRSSACADCSEYFGHWIGWGVGIIYGFNVAAWVAGLVAGGAGRLILGRQ